MIEDVENLQADFDAGLLCKPGLFRKSRVELKESGCRQRITPKIAPSPFCRNGKCGDVQPASGGSVIEIEGNSRNKIGPLCRERIAVENIGRLAGDGNINR